MEDYTIYLLALVAVIVVVLVLKKVTSCLLKAIVTLIIEAADLYIYYMYYSGV